MNKVKAINTQKRGPKLLWIPLCKGNHLALYDNELAEGLSPEMFQRGIRRAKGIKRRKARERRANAKKQVMRLPFAGEKEVKQVRVLKAVGKEG